MRKLPVLQDSVPGRICWECEHVIFHSGSPDYSELTPGNDMYIGCGRWYWEIDTFDDTLTDFRTKLTSAEKCADFTKRED